jgi:acyl-CoA synthetase (AMP-forming)/AMP-acid ligase II
MLTFGQLSRRNGQHWPQKDAFVEIDRRVPWGEFDARTDALGRAIRSFEVRPGERVAIVASDCIEVAETMIACAKIGAIRVGLNARLAAAEILALLKDCTPRLIFVQSSHRSIVDALRADLEASPHGPEIVGFGAAHGMKLDYEDLIARHRCCKELIHTPFEIVMIAYTTGSTGLPKGAIYPHEKFLNTILYTSLMEGLTHDAVWLHAMPAAGVPMMHLLRNLFQAATTAIVGPWDAQRALSLISREKATNCVLVPTMLNSLMNVANFGSYDVSSMRLLGYGASPLPPGTIRDAMKMFGCPFLQMYGTTELLGMATMLHPSDHELGLGSKPELLASAGRPLSWVDTKIVSEEGDEVPIGEIGELLVRSDVAFPGYWGAPEKTAEVMMDGWVKTGDLARRDAGGYIYLSVRAKFRIKTGGYNVFPTEIENVLAEHPAVDEVAVFGLPDPVWGDRIEAVVSLKRGQSAHPDELKDFCRDKIANFKIPKRIEVWEQLPKGVTGKIQKRAIIEQVQRARAAEAPRS